MSYVFCPLNMSKKNLAPKGNHSFRQIRNVELSILAQLVISATVRHPAPSVRPAKSVIPAKPVIPTKPVSPTLSVPRSLSSPRSLPFPQNPAVPLNLSPPRLSVPRRRESPQSPPVRLKGFPLLGEFRLLSGTGSGTKNKNLKFKLLIPFKSSDYLRLA